MVKTASYICTGLIKCLNPATILVQTHTSTNIYACTASECVSKYLFCMHQGALSRTFPSVSVWLCGCGLAAPPFNIAAEVSRGKQPTCRGGPSPGSRAALCLMCEYSGKSLWCLTPNLLVKENTHYPVCLIPAHINVVLI